MLSVRVLTAHFLQQEPVHSVYFGSLLEAPYPMDYDICQKLDAILKKKKKKA